MTLINPKLNIEDLDLKWELGKCSLCREKCLPDAYLHFPCADARASYIDAKRKKFWEDFKQEKK